MRRAVTAGTAIAGAAGAAWWFSHLERVPPTHSALQPNTTLTCPLIESEQLTADTARFRFALPTSQHVLGLPTASHIVAVDNAMVYREYTPVTLDKFDKGFFDLIVKKYPNGYISQRIHKLTPGDTMDFRGPITTLQYGPGQAACLGMVAGGTGITPMYQIIRTVLSDPTDKTQLRLLYASRSNQDILLRKELDELAQAHPEQLKVQYLIDREIGESSGENVRIGAVDSDTITGLLLPPRTERTAVLVCGPPGMMNYLCGPAPPKGSHGLVGGLMRKLGYGRQVVRFD